MSDSSWPWWKTGVIYQIYPRSFADSNGDGIGDLRGVIDKLDYLNDGTPNSLGIDAIWFSPFFPSPQADFGYDVADYTGIDPAYGTMDDFDCLLEEAHKRGIRIILDLVVNHTSDHHPWFIQSRSTRDNPYRNWYIWRDGRGGSSRGPAHPPNNWRGEFGGSAWTWDPHTRQWYLTSFTREQVDLNWKNPEVKKAVLGVMRFWLDKGVDGFRLDVAHLYGKDPELDNPPFWRRPKSELRQPFFDRDLFGALVEELALPKFQHLRHSKNHPDTHAALRAFREVLDEYPERMAVGEIVGDDVRELAGYFGLAKDGSPGAWGAGHAAAAGPGTDAPAGTPGDELNLVFNFEFTGCRWGAGPFARAVERWEKVLPSWGWPCYTLSNHDVPRHRSRYEGGALRAGRSSGATGEERARLAAMMLLTLRGTPFLYYGEEIGMKERPLSRHLIQDPVGRRFWPLHPGRDGCRTPMQWSDRPGAGFTGGEPWLPLGLDWQDRNVENQEDDPTSLLSLYRRLIWLRRSEPVLQKGSYARIESAPRDCFVYRREYGGRSLLVALNFSRAERLVRLDGAKAAADRAADSNGAGFTVLASTRPGRDGESVGSTLALGPGEGCLLEPVGSAGRRPPVGPA